MGPLLFGSFGECSTNSCEGVRLDTIKGVPSTRTTVVNGVAKMETNPFFKKRGKDKNILRVYVYVASSKCHTHNCTSLTRRGSSYSSMSSSPRILRASKADARMQRSSAAVVGTGMTTSSSTNVGRCFRLAIEDNSLFVVAVGRGRDESCFAWVAATNILRGLAPVRGGHKVGWGGGEIGV